MVPVNATNQKIHDYSAFGHFEQRIYISPGSNTVIIRFGEKSGGISWETAHNNVGVYLDKDLII
jgi:hypothetical protein